VRQGTQASIASDTFRRHIGNRAGVACPRDAFSFEEGLDTPEIRNENSCKFLLGDNVIILVQQKVLRFEITMDDASAVKDKAMVNGRGKTNREDMGCEDCVITGGEGERDH